MSPTKVQSTTTEACPFIASQTRRGCLCNPPHPRVGGMHPCHLDPLTEVGRGGSGPMSPPVQKHHPGMLQRLHRCLLGGSLCPCPPLQGMGSCHRAPSQCQAPQREDFPPLPCRTEGT